MGNHKNSRTHILIQLCNDFQQNAGGMGVQRSRRFICHNHLRTANHGPCKGTALFLPSGNLIRKFFQDITDMKLICSIPYSLVDFLRIPVP